MSEIEFSSLALLAVGLGLLGFIEPCSMGANLLFIKYLEGKATIRKLTQTTIFMLTRGLFIGALGALAGRAGFLMRSLGPGLRRLSGGRVPAALGVLFGLNIPACAAPLLFALFAAAAVGDTTVAQGFLILALFGLALSVPLVLAVLWAPGSRLLDRFAGLSHRIPRVTGAVLIIFGLWSIYFGLFVRLEDWI